MTEINIKAHTDAVLPLLAALEPQIGVGDHTGAGLSPPFVVVYRGMMTTMGTLDEPHADGSIPYQFSCVGESREAAEGVADAVRPLVMAGPSVAGRHIARVQHVGSRGAMRDEQSGEQWFTAVEEINVWTTPEGGG